MTPAPQSPDDPAAVRSPVRMGAYVVAVVFLLVGILGFVPGFTTNLDELSFAGHESNALLFDVFAVSVLHNVIHLLFGVVGLMMARGARKARIYLIAGGAIYLALFIYGLIIDYDSEANVVPLNDAANWLHLGLGVGMILLGLLPGWGVRGRRGAER
ncbi:DUF4383 domain-containing protein [Phytoactinopolyspora alkaliphila]|uniref:DUF4383 domain-containing protein n=1 Tax=Phytoactinopolyspora alkaliphila TaxID=1783498 RepID=A0A6N9YNU1_9ACTN|nr:DUF4383 domain-containing protein [Phytoactinopolyspora alkaliphila]NED96508.1 DUF4383 domain-containing protein [Phytoactinopolyspora alkaliphila]